jgi:PadR family transcriptional regulator PadR
MRHRNRHRGRRGHIRRFLEPCLLLMLRMGKSHGYELSQAIAPFGLGEVDLSLVYRMLRQMEAAGLVVSKWDADASSGAPRRVYRLTEQGERRLSAWVDDLGDTDRFLHRFFDTYADQAAGGGSDDL